MTFFPFARLLRSFWSGNANPKPRNRSAPLTLEALEDRAVPAGLVGDLVVFGDSLADVSNVAAATGGTIPAHSELYFQGRFSSGPIWVDTLAEYLQEPLVKPSLLPGGLDYAFGGATLAVVNTQPPFNLVPPVGTQVAMYLGTHAPKANDLFAFWAGPNDFFFSSPTVSPLDSAAALANSIKTLIDGPGDAKQFIVGNMVPLGQTPYFQDLREAGFLTQTDIDNINLWSGGFNQALSAYLQGLRQAYPAVTIVELDVATLFAQSAQPGNAAGFTNWTDAVGPYDPATGHLVAVTAANSSNYLFFDSVHPGTKAHQLIGLQAAANVLSALGVNTLTVTSTADTVDPLDGKLTLREALNLANVMPGKQQIKFSLTGVANEIKLGSQLNIADSVTITGPTSGILALNGQGATRIFNVAAGTTSWIGGLTLRNGKAEQGGAIYNAGDLTVKNINFQGNRAVGATATGGAIHNTGTLLVQASAFLNNSAVGTTTGAGGAIANVGASAQVTVYQSTLLGNAAEGGSLAQGGGLANLGGGWLTLQQSTLLMNSATGRNGTGGGNGGTAQGGGIYNGANARIELFGSTLLLNSARGGKGSGTGLAGKGEGGGLYLGLGSLLTRSQTLIMANSASTAGWDVFTA